METPSSTRRITRSQTKASAIPLSRKFEDSTEKSGVSKSRNQQDRSALIDITNDSPIVGLALGSLKTPSSALAKKTGNNGQVAKYTKTPGSGEALLRSHITTLLQKVEEETEISKFSLEDRPFLHLKGFVHSPAGLIAPTPANTPLDSNLSGDESFKKSCLAAVTPSPVQEQLQISQVISDLFDGKSHEKNSETESCYVTRSLLQDFFSENSEVSAESSACSSILSYNGGIIKEKSPSTEDDNSSVWSMQVNASTGGEEDDFSDEDSTEEVEEEEEDYHLALADYDYGEAEKEEDGGWVDELCEGISNINVNGERRMMPKFAGKHTRFVYNSDGELEAVKEDSDNDASSPEVLRLKGLPTPKGKHLRFPEEN